MPARHLPARALQWQAGRSRSGEAGGLILLILSKKFRRRRLSSRIQANFSNESNRIGNLEKQKIGQNFSVPAKPYGIRHR